MRSGILGSLWVSVALTQVPQQAPIEVAIRAYQEAHNDGRFEEAAARRDEVRSLLARTGVVAPQFGSWVQQVAHLYQGGGMGAQARTVVEEALLRAGVLGESHPTRILLLNTLADYWQEDRNLLKSLVYREKAAAALDAVSPAESPLPGAGGLVFVRGAGRGGARLILVSKFAPAARNSYAYGRLADLYQQLGRWDAAATVLTKMRALAQDNDAALARLYERQGQLDEAAAIYKKRADQAAANPESGLWELTGPLQSLANLYEREQHYRDAAAVIEQAIATLEASEKPEAYSQTISMRLSLASILNRAGQTQSGDQIYRQLLVETQNGRHGLQHAVLLSYADYLGVTKRGAQGERLLTDYLARHPNLQPSEEANLLFSLASLARVSGQMQRADEYQLAATEKQEAARPTPPGTVSITRDAQRAQSAANRGNLDEAFSVALHVLDMAPLAVDRGQVAWLAPSIAATLAGKGSPDKAEYLYQRVCVLFQSWSADTLQPLLNVQQQYVRFLVQQHRWDEVPGAIERYRNTLTSGRGPATGWLKDVLWLIIDFERSRGFQASALAAAKELAALEESLSGTTSQPYLRAIETLAELYEGAGDPGQALALRRQAVGIADLAFTANDPQRGFTRANAALALARQGQFDEAERLAIEAVAIGQQIRPPQPNLFTSQLEQIRQMRIVPQSGHGSGSGGGVAAGGRWFDRGFFGR